MASKAASVPRENELLCEHCGYGLDGLPDAALCPECGRPVAESILAPQRRDTAWEQPAAGFAHRFWGTGGAVITRPRAFFRAYRSRGDPRSSRGFAFLCEWAAAYLFGLALAAHYFPLVFGGKWDASGLVFFVLLGGALFCPFIFLSVMGVRRLAGWLSALESRYHGLRLPLPVVTRAMHYHTAHLLPVAAISAVLAVGYRAAVALRWISEGPTEQWYVYGLCAWIVLAAGYLFGTYWMAMKAVMYANR